MKLISLNLEGKRHLETTLPFIENEQPDCVALMEATADTQSWLQDRGYTTTFSPMADISQDGVNFEIGLLFASKDTHTATTHYYYRPELDKDLILKETYPHIEISHPVIFANVQNINIAATHFTWNPNGETADSYQTHDLRALLSHLESKPPHILCGDFNIPRRINNLYNELVKHYKDEIPAEYESSLDINLHRLGKDPNNQNVFKNFMVDYLFTQPPYKASNTRLEFGVSDHAAIVTTIDISD